MKMGPAILRPSGKSVRRIIDKSYFGFSVCNTWLISVLDDSIISREIYWKSFNRSSSHCEYAVYTPSFDVYALCMRCGKFPRPEKRFLHCLHTHTRSFIPYPPPHISSLLYTRHSGQLFHCL